MSKPSVGLTNFDSDANTVTSEQFNSDANLFYISLPIANPESYAGSIPLSENIPFLPKRKIFVVAGIFEGTESEIRDFVDEIEGEAMTPVQTVKTYTNAIGKTYGCKVANFTYTLSNEGNFFCRYQIEFNHEAVR